MYKRILALLLVFAFKAQANDLFHVHDKAITYKESLGEVHLLVDDNGFKVAKDGELKDVENCFVDPLIQSMKDNNKLGTFLEKGCKIAIVEMEDGSFKLNGVIPGLGGGVFGAWLGSTAGYFLVSVAGHGLCELAAVCTGPLYPATAYTLHTMFAAPIHAAACAGGVAGGVTVGVATGPV